MTDDKVEKDKMVLNHLTDLQIADQVRKLPVEDLGHENIITGASDRILYLSQERKRLLEVLVCCREALSKLPIKGHKLLTCLDREIFSR